MTLQPVEHRPLSFVPVAPARTYTGRQTAERVDLSWERFRKVRERWTRDRDFPAELNEPGEPVRYDADAVERWIERRSRRVHQPAPVEAPAPVASAAARNGRAALRQLKGRG